MVKGLEFEIIIPGIKSINLIATHAVYINIEYQFMSHKIKNWKIIYLKTFTKWKNKENIYLYIMKNKDNLFSEIFYLC